MYNISASDTQSSNIYSLRDSRVYHVIITVMKDAEIGLSVSHTHRIGISHIASFIKYMAYLQQVFNVLRVVCNPGTVIAKLI